MVYSFRTVNLITGITVFLMVFGLYVTTLAPSVVPGDPGEYQFIPHILGIAHPPGYAFFTLLAKLWTSVVRIGSVAFRSNLLSAASGAWTVFMAYKMVLLLCIPGATGAADAHARKSANFESSPHSTTRVVPSAPETQKAQNSSAICLLPALFAAAVLTAATDLWQHSIHANSHIVSAALAASTLYSGLRWWSSRRDGWLYGFAFLAALGVTHHPLLAVGAPAYVAFVLTVRPRLPLDWPSLTKIVLVALLGFSALLYLPLRAGATPFGPSANLDAIIGHATARGIRGNLFFFGITDQPVRLRVFWELLRLQFDLSTIFFAIAGLAWLAWRRPRPFILLTLYYALNLAFTINTVQDVMAYLLLPFVVTSVLAGTGVWGFIAEGQTILRHGQLRQAVLAGLTLVLAIGPTRLISSRAPRISLRSYHLADEYIDAVFEQFDGTGEGAVLLAPWEGITPLNYAEFVDGRRLDPADVKTVFVASGTENPWVEFVWKHIEDGPIYLADYRPQVVAEGFRLRPVGDWPLYKLEAPPATRIPDISHPLDLWAGDAVHLLGWDLDRTELSAGDTAYLTLYMSSQSDLTDYFMPYLEVGDRLYRWTTDSRLNTPWWNPGEVVVERYGVTIPFGTSPGDYSLNLGVTNLSQGEDLTLSTGQSTVRLPTAVNVQAPTVPAVDSAPLAALSNIDSRIVLLAAQASARGQTVSARWIEPLIVRPGDSIQVWLEWRALVAIDRPFTVFVHLIDSASQIRAQHDYTPMGGAFPTFLWIPRWIEGQRIWDPYKLKVPPDTPMGDYWIEIGLYGMTTLRRAQHFDPEGNLAGDRLILGRVRVEAP